MRTLTLTSLLTLSSLSVAQECQPTTTVTFENSTGELDPIGTVTGNHTITFGNGWVGVLDFDAGGTTGSTANEPSGDWTLFSFNATSSPIDITTPVSSASIWYSAHFDTVPVTMTAYDGPGGTGSIVDQAVGTAIGMDTHQNCTGDPTGSFCHWEQLVVSSAAPSIRSVVFSANLNATMYDNFEVTGPVQTGVTYCGPGAPNSTGSGATLVALGSAQVSDGCVSLLAEGLPAGEFVLLLNSPVQGFIANPGGSAGNLCLSGGIGRHTAQLGPSSASGRYGAPLNLSALPRPTGQPPITVVQPGQTWNFQAWYRDGSSSNFTSAVSVSFL